MTDVDHLALRLRRPLRLTVHQEGGEADVQRRRHDRGDDP